VQALKSQYRILNRLKQNEPFVLLVSAKNLLLKHLSIEELDSYAIKLHQGQVVSPEAVVEQCLCNSRRQPIQL
jgi:hypothetical protein